MELDVAAGIAVKLGSDDVKGIGASVADALTGSGTPYPLYFTQLQQQVGPSTGALDLGSPPMGRLWEIQSVTVTGSDAFTTVTGAVAICIGDPAAPQVTHIAVPAITIPSYRGVSSKGMWVHPNENVYALTNLIPANQVIMVKVQIQEWREKDVTMDNPGYTQYR